ncbi:crotonobetainyl-CoA:carnitine CoA-transferase CaiB-like acyl-CoA transferase [Thermocatellispora tengchongensis]|uniref:Crotonobetainyl-CoA:carnitine CoA-transferase CaiB-like acyl-CoA transferase n=1 Tax=Thermocatellispora tengchongensis TaxID=1073253 RepID=A0A840PC81_9ACTN|nr:CaiB/BaiF CoA-transferase family protein [Thermocatellispora tengchongensis]MBB5133625.1 crotonobetainyl-CoA:carnitine CoA-transferase CaiB-like acyl-CoA transferase [Thermocatellispora tengchongensis]
MLDGLKVLSFSHFVQGPSAAQHLADLGADVIKVEPPGGAWERRTGSGGIRVGGISATFLAVNRNKRAIAVDLKHPRAKEALVPLIRRADVVLENYRRGALDRLGLGYDAVRAIKPDIIYASATGWGASGPMADRPGVDLLVQARSGLISVTGDVRAAPTAAGTPIVDHHGAALLALGVLAAYARKLRTGRGGRVESSLLAAALDLQAESLTLYHAAGRGPDGVRRDGRLAAWFIDAPYGVYALADGHAVIALSGDMDGFAEAIGSPELAALGPQARLRDRDAFTRALAAALATWTYQRLEAALVPRGFWCERVADYDDVARDPQVAACGLLAEAEVAGRTVTLVRHPVRYDGESPAIRRMPPALGEHTREVLAEAGLAPALIDDLIGAGTLAAPAEGSAA